MGVDYSAELNYPQEDQHQQEMCDKGLASRDQRLLLIPVIRQSSGIYLKNVSFLCCPIYLKKGISLLWDSEMYVGEWGQRLMSQVPTQNKPQRPADKQFNNRNNSTFARMEILSTFVIICNSFIHGRKEGIVDPLDDDDLGV